jgi:hypothetical protein
MKIFLDCIPCLMKQAVSSALMMGDTVLREQKWR